MAGHDESLTTGLVFLVLDQTQSRGPRDGSMFRRVNPGRLSSAIVSQVRELIRDGTLKPGHRLPSERELGQRFGVNHLLVREAMRVLEGSGLVSMRVGGRGGAYVTAPTCAHIAGMLALSGLEATDVSEVWRTLDIGYIPLVCERASEADIADLLEICHQAEAAVVIGQHPLSSSVEFHIRLAKATHNRAIELLANTFQLSTAMSLDRFGEFDVTVALRNVTEHRQFVAAVQKRDVLAAQRVMRAHLFGAGRTH